MSNISPPSAPAPTLADGTADALVAWAIWSLGTGETNGDNINFITNWYGENGLPWCDMSVSYWAYHSGNVNSVCFGFKHDYTVEHAQTFANHGEWHTDTTGIQRGDIVFFDWAGSNNISAIDHVGIVEFVDADGVHTIEGNIDNVCKRMLRHSDFIVGYGRPAYAQPAPVPTPVPNPVPTPTPPPPVPVPTLPTVSLAHMVRAATTGWHAADYPAETTLVQNALAKLGLITFTARGVWGPATRTGYAAYQRSLGYSGSDADGIPGATSLTKLGTGTALFKETA